MDIKLFWKNVLKQNREELKKYFCPEAEIHWPCTNEKFSADEFIRVNCDYPGDWDGEVTLIENTDAGCITVTRVFARDSSAAFHVVSFFTYRDEKISFVEEYWSNDGVAPEWRQKMKIGKPIRS